MSRDELVAVLKALHVLQQASFPHLCTGIQQRAGRWGTATSTELTEELEAYVAETARGDSGLRLFWKLGPDLAFAGCNAHIVADAGVSSRDQVLGRTDFDTSFPWSPQAAKYRKDDLEVVSSGTPKLNIVERQKSSHGTQWLRTSKAPVVLASGKVAGLMGMYDVIDAALANKLMFQK